MATLTSEERILYARAVWSEFKHLSGVERDMTNLEFYHVAKWMDANIPLFVVLRAMKDFSSRPRRLEAVVSEVDRAVDYWHNAMGGAREGRGRARAEAQFTGTSEEKS